MIYQLFSNHVKLTPDATSIVTSVGDIYTYRMANDRVNQWANYFITQNIESGDRVGVILNNEDLHVFIFLALDRINACYVPFDTEVPKQQLLKDIAVLGLKKIIVDEIIMDDLNISPSVIVPQGYMANHADTGGLCFFPDMENEPLTLSVDVLNHIYNSKYDEPLREYNTNESEKIIYLVSSSGSTGNKKWIPIIGLKSYLTY